MTRTTIDIEASVLRELKRRQRAENKTLGQLASELLARALADKGAVETLPPLRWPSQNLRPKIDLEDKDALWRILGER
ncbi:MAG: antitoxin [Acidimicrobiales bacterium]